LKLLFACTFLGAFGDGLYAYLLPVYLTESLLAKPDEVGILYGVVSLFAALTLFVAGMLADKYDRKMIMIAGWIAWLPVPLIFSFAGNWLQALPGMALWGFWLGGPTTVAYIVAAADRSKLTLTFTTISAAWSLGYIFSPALGGYLSGTVGMQVVFYLASVFYALACLGLVFARSQPAEGYVENPSGEKPSFLKLLRTRKLLVLSVLFASTMFVLMMFRPFVPQFLADVYQYDKFQIGVLGSVCFFGSALLGIIVGRLGDRWRKSYALAASMVLCCGSLLFLVFSGNFVILVITFFLAGSSYIVWSLIGAIAGSLAPQGIRARWVSVPQAVSMLSSFIGPYIGGVLYDISPYYLMFVAIAATAFIALVVSVVLPCD
jgi:MFS family permease